MEREILVRSLNGESTMVSIWASKTIEDLKVLLKQTFLPATDSPNFHLFLKGVKLGLQNEISSLAIESGEFIVLVPFTKKSRAQTQKSDHLPTSSDVTNQSSNSNFAESVWSDVMEDLSSLHDTSSNDNPPKFGSERFYSFKDGNEGMADESASCSSETKRKRSIEIDKQEFSDDLVWSILRSPSKNVFDEQNSEKLIKFLASVNCLSYPYSGNCMLPRKAKDERDNSSSCLCPLWLKMLMKAFAFLNIISAFLERWQKNVTLTYLKEVINQLGKLGVQVGIADIENLSVLCPAVVCFANNDLVGTKLNNALVIINREQGDQAEDNRITGGKRKSVTNIFGAMKKRESSFKINLLETIKLLMCKNGNEMALLFSLEELLISMKEIGNAGNGKGMKEIRRSRSSTSSSPSVRSRCHGTNQLLPMEMIEHLREGIGSKGQVVHVEDIGARKAIHVKIPDELSNNTKSALKCIGVTKLYSHQEESIKASLAGKNVVVATMTSSGKSLCYNVPVLEVLSQKLSLCALYLFPTKALAQDQLRALLAMTENFDASINIGVYDGDTSQAERMWLRDNARLLITNPDMLHMSILPFHGQFSRILSNLRFVVIDEAHAYKGAFGCHTAVILRRLRRLCSHVYGSDPSFVFSTATSANPREHCMELANLSSLELIQNDGSPSAQKLFVLWNPTSCLRTVLDETESSMNTGKSANQKVVSRHPSPIMEVSRLFAEMVQHKLRCIAFCKTRKLCELVLCYTREILQETAPHLADSICSYRGGYTAQDRRRIESDLFGGRLCGIAATNALELGIDVGHIDVTLHLGFPGSVASLWQQAGRSGRRERPSLAVYVAFEGPLDQYFMKFPEKLFRRPIEGCCVDAQNQQVLEQHLVCAALEHPLSLQYDEKYFGSSLSSALMSLKCGGFLSFDPSRDYSVRIWNYIGHEKMPTRAVSIRAIENERYKVIDRERKELLEEIEESKAFFQVYEGAVYMNQGKTYIVTDLDVSSKVAMCQKADLKYYTKTRDYTDIHVIGSNLAYPARTSEKQFSRTTAQAHNCRVTTTWIGYRCIWRGSNKVFETVELSLPSFSYQSQAVWIQVTQSIKTAVENQNFPFRAGLHAASHAVLNVVPLCVMCNSSDLAPECANPHDTRYFPERILIYDQHPGGTGVSIQVQPFFTELLTSALDLVTSCCCTGDNGCPNCIQSLACHEYNEVLHKDAAAMIIKGVLDAERSYFGDTSKTSGVEL